MKRLIILAATLILLLVAIQPSLLAQDLAHPQDDRRYNQLIIDILKLALSKTAPDTHLVGVDSTLNRLVLQIENGQLNIFWTGATKEYQNTLQAIKIPILKGLLGYRIFIIRQGEQKRFDSVLNLEDLKRLYAGQVDTWGDTSVLLENNIPLVTTNKFDNLFSMLSGKRFDYLPRAIYEPWIEIDDYSKQDLTVEKNILLVYPFAMYFFVSKDNLKLAELIEEGFNIAIDDGSYDKLFFNNRIIKDSLAKAKLAGRKIFYLKNSNMPEDSPLDVAKYWIDVEKLSKKEND